jgi:nucleoside-diphosphate-sugar epimerase
VRILVLGGTSFVGRPIAGDALRSGHQVTLFSRGRTGPDLFPGVPRLVGDRDTGDYHALRDGTWDAVIDVSGYVPRHVDQAMDALGDRAGGADRRDLRPAKGGLRGRRDGPLRRPGHDRPPRQGGRPARRPGRPDLLGPPGGLRRPGGPARRPGPAQPIQVIDVRDLGRLVVQLITDDRPGAFHAVGPADPTTLAGLVHTCARAAGTEVEVVPIPAHLAPPLFPLVRTDWPSQQRSPARARAAGLPATPLLTAAADVLAWDRARGEPPLARGFTPAQEQALLAEYAASSQ